MRILVVSTNTLLKPLPVLPVGAGMVYSALTAAGFRTRFLDLAFMAEPLEALREELRVTGADLICLSVRNIDNQVIQQPESYLSSYSKSCRYAVFAVRPRYCLAELPCWSCRASW